jgi:hypothetical protein
MDSLIAVAARRPASTARGSGRSGLLRARFADDNVSTLEIGAIESGGSALGLLVGAHFHEAETFRSSAEFIRDDPSADHRAMLREMLLEPFFGHGVGKIPDV